MKNLRLRAPSSLALSAVIALLAGGAGAGLGCEANKNPNTVGGGGAGGNTGGTGNTMSTSNQGGTGNEIGIGGSGNTPNMGCDPGGPDDDTDKDGFTEAQGDCNDCDANTNPAAAEVIAEPDPNDPDGKVPDPADEDCDGLIDLDDPDLQPCDGSLELASLSPEDAVAAIGFCDKDKDGKTKFLKKATWVLADGLPPNFGAIDADAFHKGHGLLDHFGSNDLPREGKRMLVLSSGTARNKEDADFVSRNFNKQYSSNPPLTFNGESPACPGVVVPKTSVQDAAGLELEITAPSNALSLEFSFNFHSYEFPQFICTQFNDFFWVNFIQGNVNQNISFDDKGNAISVNAAFLSQCACPGGNPGTCIAPPNPAPGQPTKAFDCKATDLLAGTDFDGNTNVSLPGWTNGASGWLKTTRVVKPNETIKLRFVIFDSGVSQNGQKDHNVDSTVLIDKFRWHAIPAENETIIPD
ncbi:MAG: choice-of-anchor L domain-containing protein [Polyangiaceae bacterium]